MLQLGIFPGPGFAVRVGPQLLPELCAHGSTPPPATLDLPQWLPTVLAPPVLPMPFTYTLNVPALPAMPFPGLCPTVKPAPYATVWPRGF